MIVVFKKSPLALKLAYGVGSMATVSDKLGKELVRDGFADEVISKEVPKTQKKQTKSTKKAK